MADGASWTSSESMAGCGFNHLGMAFYKPKSINLNADVFVNELYLAVPTVALTNGDEMPVTDSIFAIGKPFLPGSGCGISAMHGGCWADL
jgi:hypothetical protein